MTNAPYSARQHWRMLWLAFHLFDAGGVDDLALVDNRRVARKAKAKMHVLRGDRKSPAVITSIGGSARDFERHVQDDARAQHDRIIDEAKALDVSARDVFNGKLF